MVEIMRCVVLVFIFLYGSTDAADDDTKIQTCEIGDVLQNECLLCVCTSKHIYKCTPKECSAADMENLAHLKEIKKPRCRPNVVYTTDNMTCICDKTGYWPHSKCEETFQTLNDTSDSCEPNSYVIVDCNVCRCGANGKIDRERCTTNICDNTVNTRRKNIKNVYGSCEPKNWYSIAPCQFCFCVSQSKLVCNTGNHYAKKLDLGLYNLNICGKGLIYEAIALIPDNDLTLRIGNLINTTVATTPRAATTLKYVKLQEKQNLIINVNQGNKIENKELNEVQNDDTSSDSEEDIPVTPKMVKEIARTQLPFSEEVDTSKEYAIDSDKKEFDSGIAIGIENQKQILRKPVKTIQKLTPPIQQPTPKQSSDETIKSLGQNLGMTLKLGLPRMLDQMFKLALRKSMLSLKGDTKCVPGSTDVVKCNMCFCMKNGKLLCTNNVCE